MKRMFVSPKHNVKHTNYCVHVFLVPSTSTVFRYGFLCVACSSFFSIFDEILFCYSVDDDYDGRLSSL